MSVSTRPTVPLTVAIPTYGRDRVLTETIQQLIGQIPAPDEILVLDQTSEHDLESTAKLEDWNRADQIRWIRIRTPSQPGAMNRGLIEAKNEVVLFIDDDIRIDADFVAGHFRHANDLSASVVIGQVLQPGETQLEDYEHRPTSDPLSDLDFPFRSSTPAWISNGMSGNMSVKRSVALSLGGFDENFLAPVSYRFDSDFCKRLVGTGRKIRFDPRPRIFHLRAERGGTRTCGSHLTSLSPDHGIGDYYFALRRGLSWRTARYILRRPFREVLTRFHLRHPWWIPIKLIGELRAFVGALHLIKRGPVLITRGEGT